MQTSYRSQDISPCPTFANPVLVPLVGHSATTNHIEYMLGLAKDELWDNLFCEENVFELQPQMLEDFCRGTVDFLPSSDVCERILQVGSRNMDSQPDQRILFKDVAESDPSRCVYTLHFKEGLYDKDILHARHPVTGHVTVHTAPFSHLPSFILPASPWIVAITASRIWRLRTSGLDDPLHRLRRALLGTCPPTYFSRAPSRAMISNSPSMNYKPRTNTTLSPRASESSGPSSSEHKQNPGKRLHR
ncbi:hypothetical protein CYLTODRAFT_408840 [Cylindrobasidium torrendii FP15055 ss-10]|uniref:Uncharacterized protein n=1 Tax=Cylindrobasidium torrendii FP15055 ss-10 TaxID=1314674 RepID=A0A0D7BLK1_9AGAR|nr:hypothetical protein CYLTODRAFT_408840 [Cylindrobasidium torrendii FP15055 ss-10]